MSQIQFEEQQYNTQTLDAGLWKRILALMRPLKKELAGLFVLMIAVAGCDVLFPLMNKLAIDTFAPLQKQGWPLVFFALIYLAAVLFQALAVYLFFMQAGKIEMAFSYDVRQQAFAKLQTLSFSYFDRTPVGWLMARMNSDIARLAEILSWSLMDLIWGVAVMVGVSVVMLIVNWQLALVVLIVVPVLAWLSVWFQTRILKSYRSVRRINSRITSSFNEGISGAKTTKTLVIEQENLKEFDQQTRQMKESSIRAATLSALFMPLVMGLGALSSAAILWLGGHQVLMQTLQFGTLMMFTQYATQFFEPLRQIARLIAELQLAQASAERVLSLLESVPQVVDSPEVIERYGTELNPKPEHYGPMRGDIEFRHVDFEYLANERILTDFNLKVKAGQTVALVGETGSGKSTIVNLLCRFYEPVSGQILIDGVDYRQRSLGWLHSNLGYVLQAPHLFSGTIRENIRYGKLDASDEQIEQAARLVNAHDFICGLQNGYDTEVGEGGSRLSTGQKQLISFARAVLADPRLFVLDEATASIDTETEQVIQFAIEHLLKGRTSFIIAHRLSTIIHADLILVMKKGKIVERGTHSQLMALDGYYAQLYTAQFREEQENRLLNR